MADKIRPNRTYARYIQHKDGKIQRHYVSGKKIIKGEYVRIRVEETGRQVFAPKAYRQITYTPAKPQVTVTTVSIPSEAPRTEELEEAETIDLDDRTYDAEEIVEVSLYMRIDYTKPSRRFDTTKEGWRRQHNFNQSELTLKRTCKAIEVPDIMERMKQDLTTEAESQFGHPLVYDPRQGLKMDDTVQMRLGDAGTVMGYQVRASKIHEGIKQISIKTRHSPETEYHRVL